MTTAVVGNSNPELQAVTGIPVVRASTAAVMAAHDALPSEIRKALHANGWNINPIGVLMAYKEGASVQAILAALSRQENFMNLKLRQKDVADLRTSDQVAESQRRALIERYDNLSRSQIEQHPQH